MGVGTLDLAFFVTNIATPSSSCRARASRRKDVELDLGPEVDSVARPAIRGRVAFPELGTETDKVRDGGETPDRTL